MDIRKLQRAIVDGLEDVKAHDIVVLNTEHLSPLFERVIVASGTSNRQTKALASSVRETVKARGLPVLSTEGAENGEWIIVDCGAAVAHIMQPAIRDYYRLEEIWGGKPVRVKLLDGKPATPHGDDDGGATSKAGVGRRRAAAAPAPKAQASKSKTVRARGRPAMPAPSVPRPVPSSSKRSPKSSSTAAPAARRRRSG